MAQHRSGWLDQSDCSPCECISRRWRSWNGRRDPDDARLVRLHLTDKAREIYPIIQAERRDIERRIVASLTNEEQRHLRSALKKIIAELSVHKGD